MVVRAGGLAMLVPFIADDLRGQIGRAVPTALAHDHVPAVGVVFKTIEAVIPHEIPPIGSRVRRSVPRFLRH